MGLSYFQLKIGLASKVCKQHNKVMVKLYLNKVMYGLEVEEIVVADVHADTEVQTRVASINKKEYLGSSENFHDRR